MSHPQDDYDHLRESADREATERHEQRWHECDPACPFFNQREAERQDETRANQRFFG